jgi:16S rRNA (uracil1498-N3)-methyltransferase
MVGGTAVVAGREIGHLRRALRLRPGDRVVLFDDEGWEHEGLIRACDAARAEVEILRSYQPGRESPLAITLAQAVGKGEKLDWVVEKSTELGVRAFIPFFSSRSVPRWDSRRAESRRARWERIAISAAKQSGRTRVPTLAAVTDFDSLLDEPSSYDLKFLLWEGESERGLKELCRERQTVGSVLLIVGPEGGFSAQEVSRALDRGFHGARFGGRILRMETAAVAAVAVLQFVWGDLA